jgi:hypothetical protein
MSLVDRWLSRPRSTRHRTVATTATFATSGQIADDVAGISVETDSLQAAISATRHRVSLESETTAEDYASGKPPVAAPSEQMSYKSQVSQASTLNPKDNLVFWQDRAAIVEYDGNIPRQWAEGFARLNPDHPPAGVPLKRWQRFVDDVGLFLDSPFCAVAAALGWGPYDLFGCDRDRPFARLDLMGLIWLMNGAKLVTLTEETATIELATGSRQMYSRHPIAPGMVLAWELASSPASLTNLPRIPGHDFAPASSPPGD